VLEDRRMSSFRFHRWMNKHGVSRRKLSQNKMFAWLSNHLLCKDLWLFHRDSLARGWLIGSLAASNPFLGFQIAMAMPFNIFFRGNILVTIFLILLTNPATIIPFCIFAYWLGCQVLREDMLSTALIGEQINIFSEGGMSFAAVQSAWQFLWGEIGVPLLFGCLSIGLGVGLIGYFLIMLLWKTAPKRHVSAHKHHVRNAPPHKNDNHSSSNGI